MNARDQEIRRLQQAWGDKCPYCQEKVAIRDAFPLSPGTAHKRCYTAAILRLGGEPVT